MNTPFLDKLIVTDLDGTFLGRDARLVEENVAAVKRFVAGGGRFSLATGRGLRTLTEAIVSALSLCNAPVIACNGAVLFVPQTKEVLCCRELLFDSQLRTQLALCAAAVPALTYWIHTTDSISAHFSVQTPCDFPTDTLICKVVLHIPVDVGEDAMTKVRQALERALTPRAHLSRSSAEYLEILPCGTDKGSMLSELKAYLEQEGEPPLTVYAVGDYENDLPMLAASDVAACPANASEQVKAACRVHLCDHDAGAIADLIAKIEADAI